MQQLKCLLVLSFVFFFSANAQSADIVGDFEDKIADLKGQVVYIDFWASWCIPCRQSFPWMNEMQSKYKDQGLKVITVNLDHKKALAEAFLKEYPGNFEVVYDPKGKLAKKFKLKGMPNSFIVNKDGKLVSRHVGFNDQKKIAYENELKSLLEL